MINALEPRAPQRADDLLSLLEGYAPNEHRRLSSLEVTVIRPLTKEDLLTVLSSADVTGPTTLTTIRHAHHRIAQLIVEGAQPTKVSFITGYSPAYVSRLREDPVFRELLAYYASQSEVIHVDTIEKMKNLSLTAIDELSQRLEEKPEEWTKKDLMELVKITSPQVSSGGLSGPAGPAVALNVQFIQAVPEGADAPPMVDITNKVKLPPEQEI